MCSAANAKAICRITVTWPFRYGIGRNVLGRECTCLPMGLEGNRLEVGPWG